GDRELEPVLRTALAVLAVRHPAEALAHPIKDVRIIGSLCNLFASVRAARVARFVNGDLDQTGELWREAHPDEAREVLARRVLEARNLVQIAMIEDFEEGFECLFEIVEVAHPPGVRIDLSGELDVDAEGVTVKACALMPRRHVGEPVRSLEGDRLFDL